MLAPFSFSDLRDRFARLSQREQLLVVLVVGAALYLLVDSLVYAPQQRREQALIESQRQLQTELVVVSADIAAVERTRAENLEQKAREYQRLKQQAALLERVATSVSPEVPPVRALASEVLGAQQDRVRTVGVKTVPVRALPAVSRPQTPGATDTTPPLPAMYRHGLEIELRGRYLDLVDCLRQLEDSHPKLFWSNAVLSADKPPESSLRVSVFMLSKQSHP